MLICLTIIFFLIEFLFLDEQLTLVKSHQFPGNLQALMAS